ncbi:MAG TPA: hypothetical protein VMW38_08510, partial [Terriglobia bacterium]|nr:hypothetical protein [Terriglobia bacterium]
MQFQVKLFVGLLAVGSLLTGLTGILHSEDPSYEQAVARWADMPRPITFLGCKDHPDEFGVMWNGNLTLTSPTLVDADRRLFKDRRDESLQVSFSVGDKPEFPNRDRDDGSAVPSLAEGYLPIAQIRVKRNDVVLQEEAFVSNSDGNCLADAWNDPVFLRVRFTVLEVASGNSPIHLWAQLAKNHTGYAMREVSNVRIDFVAPLYDRKLQANGNSLLDSRGLVVMDAPQDFRFYPELPTA